MDALNYQDKPLTYRFVRKSNGSWYVNISIDIDELQKFEYKLATGVDFNKGFITMSEVNLNGSFLNVNTIPFRNRITTSSKAKTEMQQKLSRFVKDCKAKQSSIVIESLDFDKKKINNAQNNKTPVKAKRI